MGAARRASTSWSKSGEPFVNELNTMPGSLAFYLWQYEGMSPSMLCDELIRLALRRTPKSAARSMITAPASSQKRRQGGLKGVKGVKGLKGLKGSGR